MNGKAARILGAAALILGGTLFPCGEVSATTAHRVKSGETLWRIAVAECGRGSRWPDIAELNGIVAPYRLSPGMTLLLPQGCGPGEENAEALEVSKTSNSPSGNGREIRSRATRQSEEAGRRFPKGEEKQEENNDRGEADSGAARRDRGKTAETWERSWTRLMPRGAGGKFREPERMTLEEAVAEALEAAPEIIAAREEYLRTRALIGVARADALPQVTASGEWQDLETFRSTSVLGLDESSLGGTLEIDQNLLTFGRISHSIAASKADAAAAEAALAEARIRVRYEVEAAFLNALLEEERLHAARDDLEVARRFLETTRARYRLGTGTRLDVMRAESRLAEAEADVARREGNLSAAWEALPVVMGRPPSMRIRPQGRLELTAAPVPAETAESLAIRNRPDLAVLRFNVESGEALVKFERAQLYPTVTGSIAWSRKKHDYKTASLFFTGEEESYRTIGIGISVPVFDGFRAEKKVASRKADVAALRARLDRAILDARRDVRKVYYDLYAASRMLTARSKSLLAAEEALRMAEVSFKAGTIPALDLLEAADSLREARVARAEAAYAYRLGLARLRAAAATDSVIRRR